MNRHDTPHGPKIQQAHGTFHRQKNQLMRISKTMGFRAAGNTSVFRRNGLSVWLQRRWLVAKSVVAADTDPLHGQLGCAGLWKIAADGDKLSREFHLPISCLFAEQEGIPDDDCDEGGELLQDCLEWIVGTAAGELPSGWQCPSRDEIESWLSPGALTIESGPLVRQGLLRCEVNCLRLRFPVASLAAREQISPARRMCLNDLLLDAQSRWRMVRIGTTGASGQETVVTEVDLSGAPLTALRCLLKTGLDAIRWVTSSLVWSTALLADARIECGAVENWQSGQSPQKVSSL
jgi:hypothetical protein